MSSHQLLIVEFLPQGLHDVYVSIRPSLDFIIEHVNMRRNSDSSAHKLPSLLRRSIHPGISSSRIFVVSLLSQLPQTQPTHLIGPTHKYRSYLWNVDPSLAVLILVGLYKPDDDASHPRVELTTI